MSQFTIVSVDEARGAMRGLHSQLSTIFNESVRDELFTGRYTVKRISTAEWGLAVGLKREPTADERAKMPKEYDGVKVSYKTGPLNP